MRHERDQPRGHGRQRQKRTRQPARRQSSRAQHHKLAVSVHLVERVENRGKKRDGRDNHHERRDCEPGDAQKQQQCLPLAGHQIDLAQRLGDPDDGCQNDKAGRESRKSVPENVAVYDGHL